MSYYGWKPYVTVAERRRKAEKAAARARKKSGTGLSPVPPSRGAIARTFWGKGWCDNLERYSDFANRLPRGRTYVRNGSVIDLQIGSGEVHAKVVGSTLYEVDVTVAAVPAKQWQAISADCAGSIDSMVELLQGRLSNAVMERICRPHAGLFPAPKEIQFTCSCPDWASMCKHVAAVLYGVGARLDSQPELIFALRRVDARDLVAHAGTGLRPSKSGPAPGNVLADAHLADVFGLDMADDVPAKAAAARRAKPAASPSRKVPCAAVAPKVPAATVTRKVPAAASNKKEPAKVVVEKGGGAIRTATATGTTRKTTAGRTTRAAQVAAAPERVLAKALAAKSGARSSRIGKARLAAMIEEATVDAYGEADQAVGWYTVLEEHLGLPFESTMLGVAVKVARLGILRDNTIVAVCTRGRTRQQVPILDLPLPSPRPAGAEWIDAYRQWVGS